MPEVSTHPVAVIVVAFCPYTTEGNNTVATEESRRRRQDFILILDGAGVRC